jgi:hypothetical protein
VKGADEREIEKRDPDVESNPELPVGVRLRIRYPLLGGWGQVTVLAGIPAKNN